MHHATMSLRTDVHTGRVGIGSLAFWQVVLILCSFASYSLRIFTDSLLLYLPLALSLILIHWYGWRMLPVIYFSAIVSLLIWKAPGPWWRIVLVATHEPLVAAASKVLVDRFVKKPHEEYFTSTNAFVGVILFGVILPISINSFYVYHYSFVGGDLQKVLLYWLADLITALAISVPSLYLLRPSGKSIIEFYRPLPILLRTASRGRFVIELGSMLVVFIFLSFQVPYDKYWFIYGIGALAVAIRLGFEWVIVVNVSIFILNYILPLTNVYASASIQNSERLISVHLGSVTLIFISYLVGRVITDLRQSEKNLVQQKVEIEKANKRLKQANQELDRFVYSVSHDLSAPLKSIKGLINITRLDKNANSPYLGEMERSVTKLEDFISEVLDYSRTSRKDLLKEDVSLPDLYKEITEKFEYLENYSKVTLTTDFSVHVIQTDRVLLKTILSNLISNAIKYQKKYNDHDAFVKVRSFSNNGSVCLEVIDNGEGIREENQEKVFDMFYRGTTNASGSGLGLYIAREAVSKLGGTLQIKSTYGEGSTFSLILASEEDVTA